MSYCRWSSDGYQCPLYCYESETGFITHVASRKPIIPCPELRLNPETKEFDNWDEYQAWMKIDKTDDDYVDYNLPYDGKTFEDDTLEDMRDTILKLKEAGYDIPSWLIPVIDAEIADDVQEKP